MSENQARYQIVDHRPESITITDVGHPHDIAMTVTNDAGNVVRRLYQNGRGPLRLGMRLFYYDSDGRKDEIIVKSGPHGLFFDGFARGEVLA